MPCYDHRNSPDYVRAEVTHEMTGRITELAAWLCYALGTLESLGLSPLDPKLKQWWEDHKDFDTKRKENT